jgi:hypothetical protein
MVDALTNDDLIHEAPAIVGCHAPSVRAHAAAASRVTRATGAARDR